MARADRQFALPGILAKPGGVFGAGVRIEAGGWIRLVLRRLAYRASDSAAGDDLRTLQRMAECMLVAYVCTAGPVAAQARATMQRELESPC